MASINWIVTEITNSVGVPNNVGVIEAIRMGILHIRSEQIRRHYDDHRFVDKGLMNRIPVKLITVPDGDIPVGLNNMLIKRSATKVATPVRIANNLPFNRVSTTGAETNVEIAYCQETRVRYMKNMANFCAPMYDYINGFVYVYANKGGDNNDFNTIQIEAAFEWNIRIIEEMFHKGEGLDYDPYEDEAFVPEDMVPEMKVRALQIAMRNVPYETNEDVEKNA
jgi:hypothetical protein